MDICVFEDRGWRTLLPLTYARPVFSLLCGTRSLLQKTLSFYPDASIRLACRPLLKNLTTEEFKYPANIDGHKDGTLFINGRLILNEPIPLEGPEEFAVKNDILLFARLKKDRAAELTADVLLHGDMIALLDGSVAEVRCNGKLLDFYWDIVNANKSELMRELGNQSLGTIEGKVYDGAHLVNREGIFIGDNAKIKPGAVIDAEDGPVYIGEGTVVNANSSIEGPVFIGRDCMIQASARICPGSTLGEVSKVGGEIEESIIHGYSNKQHDGFLGHAYIGSWVNLAADTINSDLKNTYGTVRVSFGNITIDSGETFVGLAVGDHSKSAINASFLTGSVVGFGSNVVVSGFPPKFVPSFSWCTNTGIEPYRLEKSLEVAKLVMARRKKKLTRTAERVFRAVYKQTAGEREAVIEEWEE